MGFIESYADVIDVERGFLKQMVENIGKTCADELALLKAELPKTGEFPEVRLKEGARDSGQGLQAGNEGHG